MIFINRQGVEGEVMTEKEKLVLFDNFPDKYHPSGPALRIFTLSASSQPDDTWRRQWAIHLILLGVTQYFTIKYSNPRWKYILTSPGSRAGREAPYGATVAVIGSGYGQNMEISKLRHGKKLPMDANYKLKRDDKTPKILDFYQLPKWFL